LDLLLLSLHDALPISLSLLVSVIDVLTPSIQTARSVLSKPTEMPTRSVASMRPSESIELAAPTTDPEGQTSVPRSPIAPTRLPSDRKSTRLNSSHVKI